MSGIKRPATDQDPDYEEVQPQQEKRQRLHEEGAKELTICRIDGILRSQFAQERENKESEVLLIDERLNKARLMADRLRACIVASFYSRTATLGQGKSGNQSQPSIHPTVKKHMGKAPRSRTQGPPEAETHNREASVSKQEKKDGKVGINSIQKTIPATKQEDKAQTEQHVQVQGLTSRFKVKKRIIVGNLSKYIPVDKREDNDRSTHRWMVYVRGSAEEPHIDHFVDKVWFFLHPSYKPNDLVEIREHPFHLTRRGWGEFPVRVQLHFKDTRNKRVDVIHNLKLDRTYTGLQTLGSETVVDVELEKDSIGLPQPPPPEPLPVAKVPKSSECDVMLEALTAPQNDTQGAASNVMVKQEVDLSIVKSEPLDVASVSDTLEVRAGEVVTSPMSPPRPGTVTPVKMVFGALGTSPARVASPASSASTPVKEGSGWTRIQIKSEPSSPRASPVSKKGWQNITTLTSPVKSEVVSETFSPPLVIKTEPGQMIMSSPPPKVILAQGQRLVSQGPTQNRIGLVTGQSASGMSLVSQSSLLRLPAVTVIQGQSQCQVLNMASSANTVTAKQQQAQQQQPTLYIRCRDHTGKVYLIPQHVLNKTSAGVTAPTVPQLTSTQVQRVSTPMGMAILSPGVATPVQSANQGNVAMGTVQALASLANSQRSNITSTASQSTSTSTPKQSSMTTTIKNAGKTATLTYVLATSAATSTTHTPTVGNHSQKVAAAHGQSLVLASTVGRGQTQNLILTTPSAQKSRPGTPLAVSKAGTTVSSRPGTPVAMGTAVSDASRSLLVSPNVAENIRIVGGSIVASSPKASNIVLINQPTAGQQISGNQQIAKGATQSGGISLLTGLTGIRPSTSWPKGTVVAQTPTRLPSTGVSLLNKTSSASTLCQLSPSTVLIKQEPGAQWTPRQTGATLVPGQRSRQPQMLLVPATTNPAKPNVIMATTAKKPQPVPVTQQQRGASPSLLTTIGNHKVIVQLLPPQLAGPTNQITAQASAANLRNPLSDIIKGNLGGGNRDSVFHQMSTKKAITPTAKPIDLSRYSCLEELVRAQVRLHPVVKAGIDRSLHPYCAESEDEFLSWKLGKRRAAEWCRAATVQKCIQTALVGDVADDEDHERQEDVSVKFHGESVWSKKRIMWWCRNHLYTPWDAGLKRLLESSMSDRDLGDGCGDLAADALSTLTDAAPLLKRLYLKEEEMKSEHKEKEDEESEEVDIISCDEKRPLVVKLESPTKPVRAYPTICLETSPTAHYVHEVAAQIGVRTRPVEVDGDEAPGVHVHAVEDMIMAVTQTLMGDVIRKAKALLLEQFKCSDELKARHIVHALTTIPLCDMLTNSGLGTLAETPTPHEVTPTLPPAT